MRIPDPCVLLANTEDDLEWRGFCYKQPDLSVHA
jgi:hypothetical protein